MSCQKLASCKPVQIASDCCRSLGFAAAKELQQQTADRISRAAAIIEQGFEGVVAHSDDVLRKRRQQVVEQRQLQLMLADCSGEVRPLGRRTAFDRVQLRAQDVERCQTFGRRRVSFIGKVICSARESINRAHRGPQVSPASATMQPESSRSGRHPWRRSYHSSLCD